MSRLPLIDVLMPNAGDQRPAVAEGITRSWYAGPLNAHVRRAFVVGRARLSGQFNQGISGGAAPILTRCFVTASFSYYDIVHSFFRLCVVAVGQEISPRA